MYRQRENSIMSSPVNIKHITSIEYIMNSFIDKFEDAKLENEKLIFSKLCFNLLNVYIGKILKMNADNKYEFIRNLTREKIISIVNYNSQLSWKQRLNLVLLKYAPYLYYKRICRKAKRV